VRTRTCKYHARVWREAREVGRDVGWEEEPEQAAGVQRPLRAVAVGVRGPQGVQPAGLRPPTASCTSHPSSERENTSATYSTLLRTELLGDAAAPVGVSPMKTSPRGEVARQYSHSSPSRNLFRFKSDGVAGLGTPPESPYSLSPVGGDGPLGNPLAILRRSPRKIAPWPLKALGAPALQDDFNLNLVDWSAHGVLAVGGHPGVE